MRLDLFRMPTIPPALYQRLHPTSVDEILNITFGSNHQNRDRYRIRDVILGGVLAHIPAHLNKVVHISPCQTYVFETVYDNPSRDVYICLYTKILGKSCDVIISSEGISKYRRNFGQGVTISNILYENGKSKMCVSQYPWYNRIVPLCIEYYDIDHLIMDTVSELEDDGFTTTTQSYSKQLLKTNGTLIEALTSGQFRQNPAHEYPIHAPMFIPSYPEPLVRWIDYIGDVTPYITYNHGAFDKLVSEIVLSRISAFTITTTFHMALEGCVDVSTTSYIDDRYSSIIGPCLVDDVRYTFDKILRCAVDIYCKIHNMSKDAYSDAASDGSDTTSVTIYKTIYDEVGFLFHDGIWDRMSFFYSSFTPIAITTLSMGSISKER